MSRHDELDAKLLPVPPQDEPGVLRTDIDAANHAVTIDFDPRVISDEGVRQGRGETRAGRPPAILQDDPASRRTRLGRGGAEAGAQGAEDRRHPAGAGDVPGRRDDGDLRRRPPFRGASHRAGSRDGRAGEAATSVEAEQKPANRPRMARRTGRPATGSKRCAWC